jgi:hypothetical protein
MPRYLTVDPLLKMKLLSTGLLVLPAEDLMVLQQVVVVVMGSAAQLKAQPLLLPPPNIV